MKSRDHLLDVVRGLSALAVACSHIRAMVFVDAAAAGPMHPGDMAFYFATGLGHQAVMVFFVLSGYFVGGSVLQALVENRFTWGGYALARLTRLWMVLLPALVFTYAVDLLGASLAPEGYAGSLHERFASGPSIQQPLAHSAGVFLGNAFFVQTILVPVFGTNGPLWSLANEFWYYALFPMVVVGAAAMRRPGQRWLGVLLLAAFVGGCSLLPARIVVPGSIWLLGVVVWAVARRFSLRGGWRWAWQVTGAAVFLGTLVASKGDHWAGSDIAIGLAFACWMLSLVGARALPAPLDKAFLGLSDMSYTLYVVHFPLTFLVSVLWLGGTQGSPAWPAYFRFSVILVLTLVCSAASWWMFERNTTWLRDRLRGTWFREAVDARKAARR